MKKAYLQLHISVFLWGFTGILGRLIDLPDALLVWYRMIITALMMLIGLLLRGNFRMPTAREVLRISLVGTLVSLHWLCFYGSIKSSGASVALSCLASTALFTSLLNPVFGGKKIHLREIFFGLAAIAGISMLYLYRGAYTSGLLLGLSASAIGALFTILNKKLMEKQDPLIVSFLEMGSGFLFLTAILPLYFSFFPGGKMIPSAADCIYLLCLSFFCTVIPFTLSLYALKKLSAFTSNLILNMEPVYGILLAVVLFREDRFLHAGFFAGSALLVATVILHSFLERRKQFPVITKTLKHD